MESVVEANAANWEQMVAKSDILTAVYFWHERCSWCARFSPVFAKVAQEYQGRARFVKLNILEDPSNREIAANLGVLSTPALVFFCGGRPIGQSIGYAPEEDLRKMLDDMLGRYRNCLRQSTSLRDYIV
jgi:thioredoxin 1